MQELCLPSHRKL